MVALETEGTGDDARFEVALGWWARPAAVTDPNRAAGAITGVAADVISSHECGRDGMTDDAQLHLAGGEARCLVTCNRDDFIRLTVAYAENSRAHAGLLIMPWTFPPGNTVAGAQALLVHPQSVSAERKASPAG